MDILSEIIASQGRDTVLKGIAVTLNDFRLFSLQGLNVSICCSHADKKRGDLIKLFIFSYSAQNYPALSQKAQRCCV